LLNFGIGWGVVGLTVIVSVLSCGYFSWGVLILSQQGLQLVFHNELSLSDKIDKFFDFGHTLAFYRYGLRNEIQ
jgi:hypothetical protein